MAELHSCGHFGRIWIGEYLAIEHTVDDIAQCAGAHQRHRHNISHRNQRGLDKPGKVPCEHAHQTYTEAGEHELAAELHPEGHAVVLDKAKMKPGENLYILSEVEIRLHPEFHQLVEHNHRRRSDNGHCGEAFRGNIVHLRFIFSLTHSVA